MITTALVTEVEITIFTARYQYLINNLTSAVYCKRNCYLHATTHYTTKQQYDITNHICI